MNLQRSSVLLAVPLSVTLVACGPHGEGTSPKSSKTAEATTQTPSPSPSPSSTDVPACDTPGPNGCGPAPIETGSVSYKVTECGFEPPSDPTWAVNAGDLVLRIRVTNHTQDVTQWSARAYLFQHGVSVESGTPQTEVLAPGGTQTLELTYEVAFPLNHGEKPDTGGVTCQVLNAGYHDLTTGEVGLPSVNTEMTYE